MAVSNRLRYEILRRDRFACRYCGARAGDGAVLEIDHVLPRVLGGSDKAENLVTACVACNSGKGSTHPDSPAIDDLDADALRWWKARRAVTEKMKADASLLKEAVDAFDEAWNRWTYTTNEERKPVPRDPAWRRHVEELMTAGLPIWMLLEAVDSTMRGPRFHAKWAYGAMLTTARDRLRGMLRAVDTELASEAGPPSSQERSATAFALDLLTGLTPADRCAAFEHADMAGAPDRTDDQRTRDAVSGALRHLQFDRADLAGAIEELLRQLPDDQGTGAMVRARDFFELTDEPSETYKYNLLSHAALYAAQDYQDAAARELLDSFSEDIRTHWIEQAQEQKRLRGWPIDDIDVIVLAAQMAREASAVNT